MRKKTFLKITHFCCLCTLFMLFPFVRLAAQEVLVTGSVFDTVKKAPLAFVSVKVLGKVDKGVATTNSGAFSLKVAKSAVIRFSLVGYESKELSVESIKKNPTIILKAIAADLDDVVVVGYVAQKRKDFSTAISNVSTKNATEGGYSNFQQLIGGRAAGVLVTENSAEPGGGINIEVRGTGSLNFSTQPLYVIDGIPFEQPNLNLTSNTNISAVVGNNVANPLSTINPTDIESLEILKDAAATAIYGSRGANGVILITTKKGKVGKTKVTVGLNQAYVMPQRYEKLLDAKDYAVFANEAWKYRQSIGTYTPSTFIPYTDGEIDSLQTYDHQRELMQVAKSTDANISISGGSPMSKYYLSGQYFYQPGIIPNTSLNRYSCKFNYDATLSPKLTMTANISVNNTERNGNATANLMGRAKSWSPASPFINPDGSFNRLYNHLYGYGNGYYNDSVYGSIYYNPRFPLSTILAANGNINTNNPLMFTSSRGVKNVNNSTQILANLSLTYAFTNSLKLTGTLALTQFNSVLQTYIPISIVPTFGTQRGDASIGNSQNKSALYQLNLSYRKSIGKHAISLAAVASAEKYISETQSVGSSGFTSDITSFYSIQSGAVPGVPKATYSAFQLVSSVLQGVYSYQDKYILNLSGRFDGTSKFADNNKYGFFPSTGLAWKVDKEKWFKINKSLVNELKLRVSFGIVGNQGINPYSTMATLSSNYIVFGNSTANIGYYPTILANPGLKWEKTQSLNSGIDIGLFQNRINVTVDAYRRFTKDLLVNVTPPLTSGFTTYTANLATMRNEGLEFSLEARVIEKKDFRLSFGGNIAFNWNKVEKLTGSAGEYYNPPAGAIGTGGYITRIEPGKPVGQFFGYKSIGIWNDSSIKTKPTTFMPSAKEGDRRYADLNNDNLLSDADRTYIGSALPKYFGGFNINISYKSFDLSSFFSYSIGSQIFNTYQITYGNMSGNANIRKDVFDKRYRVIYPDTDTKLIDAIRANNLKTNVSVAGSTLEAREATDYYIEDGSYMRCRDITIGYRLPYKLVKKAGLSSMKAYINLQNVFMITKYSGLNPEVSSRGGLVRGVDDGSAPLSRGLRIGFNANF